MFKSIHLLWLAVVLILLQLFLPVLLDIIVGGILILIIVYFVRQERNETKNL
jgi:hypothetical protein